MICQVQIEKGEIIFVACPDEIEPKIGDYIIIKLNEGEEISKVINILQAGETSAEIIRIASQEDIETYEKILKEEEEVFNLCKTKVKEMNLPIKIASTHIQFDKSVLRIDYLTDKKIGLKRLMKEIAKSHPQRIEFQQIGVRTYAKRFKAIGICGRPVCCSVFLNEFEPITVDLIKLQNLSCGASKLTGICGKLMCCLAFEKGPYSGDKNQPERLKPPEE